MNYPSFPIIDAHSHLPYDLVTIQQSLADMRLSIVNITVDDNAFGPMNQQLVWYEKLRREHPNRFGWITSFTLQGFTESGWLDRVLQQLEHDFANGACGCKVWKNVGMDIRDPKTGEYLFVDDERFKPIFDFLERARKPMLTHIGEPLACWLPLNDESPHSGYYRQFPQWHMHGKPNVPHHTRLMESRDAILARHPNLIVVGAHYGSHEYDFAEVARRFDRYPNYFVDTSARLHDAMLNASKNYPAVRDFYLKYFDRMLWGVDWVIFKPASAFGEADALNGFTTYRKRLEKEWEFFASGEQVVADRQSSKGLALPESVLRKMFHDNAKRIYSLSM